MAVIIPKLEQMGAPESQSVGRIVIQGHPFVLTQGILH